MDKARTTLTLYREPWCQTDQPEQRCAV